MFFLYILLFIIAFNVMIIFSTIKIEIKDVDFILPKKERGQKGKEYKISIKFYFLNFLRILKISITNEKIKKRKLDELMKNFDGMKATDIFEINFLDVIKKLNIKLEKIDLKIYLGTENAGITAILIGTISSILGIILRTKTDNLEKAKFKAVPLYQNKNYLEIYLEGIFKTKMIHIIYIIYVLIKKRRVDKNVRTSNRRSYAYSNE